MASSAAIYICGRPLFSCRTTASRMNSGEDSRLVFVIGLPSLLLRSLSEVSNDAGEDHSSGLCLFFGMHPPRQFS